MGRGVHPDGDCHWFDGVGWGLSLGVCLVVNPGVSPGVSRDAVRCETHGDLAGLRQPDVRHAEGLSWHHQAGGDDGVARHDCGPGDMMARLRVHDFVRVNRV